MDEIIVTSKRIDYIKEGHSKDYENSFMTFYRIIVILQCESTRF